jgi:agmatine deiminase
MTVARCRVTAGGSVSRREFVVGAGISAVGLGAGLAGRRSARRVVGGGGSWFAPADRVRHERTWMAWPARRDIWGSLLGGAQSDVAEVARTISRYEPVAMIARSTAVEAAKRACGRSVQVIEIENDDLWMRDMGPVFVVNDRGGLAGVDLNFNGWGNKQAHANDAKVAAAVLDYLGVPRHDAGFTSEGGALEVDGAGTAMATESSIINPNRNPGRSKAELTASIRTALGVRKVLWVPGVRGQDITDDHIDSLARFVNPGRVVVDQPADPDAKDVWARSERQALRILRADRDARGVILNCLTSRESSTVPAGQDPNSFVNVYVNWYVCNGAVLIPAFGDQRADAAARELAGRLYPGRVVEQLRIDSLSAGGGGIHCATQQQPAAST